MRTVPVIHVRPMGLLGPLGVALGLGLGTQAAQAAPRPRTPAPKAPAPKAPAPGKSEAKTPEQKEAERHFQSGVALFKEAKYAEALAEFERAYEIEPQPLVLYNIAGCHRELSHYSEAVTYYRRFLADGKDKVKPARLAAAQTELDAILARIARVTVIVTPGVDGVSLTLDGTPLEKPEMPLILPPGEHRLVARAAGHSDSEKSLRVASGDDLEVQLKFAEQPHAPQTPVVNDVTDRTEPTIGPQVRASHRRFALGAGFGTNLLRAGNGDSGAGSAGLAVAIGSRLELGIDAVFVAWAVIPSVRVRLVGDALSLHAVGAVPIAITDGPMTSTFAAGAIGLGLRYRATPSVAFRLESYASFAGDPHGTTVPTFLGGELWF